jgi:metacaspase-1
MAEILRILAVHGVGEHPPGGAWEQEWIGAMQTAARKANAAAQIEVSFCHYDDLFASRKITAIDMLQAVARLTASAVSAPFRQPRDLGGSLRWTAGMIVKWVEDADFRRVTRTRLADAIRARQPHAIFAHSLGSLVSYDTFTNPDTANLVADRVLVTLGSQIGNPFVSGQFRAGKIEPLANAQFWYHLFNDEDDVFTAQLRLHADNFRQVPTFFDIEGFTDHSAPHYLSHAQAVSSVWFDLLNATVPATGVRALRQNAATTRLTTPSNRALLVGINDYPAPDSRLDGCVNDAFLMSSVLQEGGLDAENIRLLLDDRATAAGIKSRLDWLLEDVREGDTRVFYYSGHGAQMPRYGLGDRVDRKDETLVPHDFDWSDERSLTDDWFLTLYSQLPYGANFIVIFDCCHSGGMTRGTHAKIRGLNPPDDVRHRALRWDSSHEMWVDREMRDVTNRVNQESMPLEGLTGRLGYAMPLRPAASQELGRTAKAQGHKGPYTPVILYACQEKQYSYEYLHGSVSHGAFTYSIAKNLRKLTRQSSHRLTFRALTKATAAELHKLGYEQTPKVSGPTVRLDSAVPFPAKSAQPRKKVAKKRKRRR